MLYTNLIRIHADTDMYDGYETKNLSSLSMGSDVYALNKVSYTLLKQQILPAIIEWQDRSFRVKPVHVYI